VMRRLCFRRCRAAVARRRSLRSDRDVIAMQVGLCRTSPEAVPHKELIGASELARLSTNEIGSL
jgi:hypothetical protein